MLILDIYTKKNIAIEHKNVSKLFVIASLFIFYINILLVLHKYSVYLLDHTLVYIEGEAQDMVQITGDGFIAFQSVKIVKHGYVKTGKNNIRHLNEMKNYLVKH